MLKPLFRKGFKATLTLVTRTLCFRLSAVFEQLRRNDKFFNNFSLEFAGADRIPIDCERHINGTFID